MSSHPVRSSIFPFDICCTLIFYASRLEAILLAQFPKLKRQLRGKCPFHFCAFNSTSGEVELWQYNGLYVSALRCLKSRFFQTTRVATSEFRFHAAEGQFASFRIWTAFLPGSGAGQDGNTGRAFELVRPDTQGTTRNAAFRIPTTLFLASAEITTHCRSRLLTSASKTRTGHSSKFCSYFLSRTLKS